MNLRNVKLSSVAFVAAITFAASTSKVTGEQATKSALSQVPGGTVKSFELEKENGKLIWSFDIAKPKTRNIIEVQVDAKTGKIVSTQTETPTDQLLEAKGENR